jgi:hypothetical protein
MLEKKIILVVAADMPGVTKTEIKIGNITTSSGRASANPLSVFGPPSKWRGYFLPGGDALFDFAWASVTRPQRV